MIKGRRIMDFNERVKLFEEIRGEMIEVLQAKDEGITEDNYQYVDQQMACMKNYLEGDEEYNHKYFISMRLIEHASYRSVVRIYQKMIMLYPEAVYIYAKLFRLYAQHSFSDKHVYYLLGISIKYFSNKKDELRSILEYTADIHIESCVFWEDLYISISSVMEQRFDLDERDYTLFAMCFEKIKSEKVLILQERIVRRGLGLYPSSGILYSYLGSSLYNQGKYLSALEAYLESEEIGYEDRYYALVDIERSLGMVLKTTSLTDISEIISRIRSILSQEEYDSGDFSFSDMFDYE